MHKTKYDYLVVGAGFFGATFAWHATHAGKRVLVIDSRDHIGGNSYTSKLDNIDIHVYGAHIFHTSDEEVWQFITRFSKFNSYVHRVYAFNNGQTYSIPINLKTFNQVFAGGLHSEEDAKRILRRECEQFLDLEPRNFEQFALSQIGTELYELLIKNYTKKQWGVSPSDLPASIFKRLPIRFSSDDRYFSDKYQGIPVNGYTRIFEGLLEGSDVQLRVDYMTDRAKLTGLANRILYTGSVDELYHYHFGELAYRTSNLTLERHNKVMVQGTTVMNYTGDDVPFTRIIEHKFFTPDKINQTNVSWCSTETSSDWRRGLVRCYPINDSKNVERYSKYKQLMNQEKNIIFGGRLAAYKYADMHTVIRDAMNLAEKEGLNVR